jgi:glycosyltransferase involved in cell wall biosynthesis
MSETPPLRVGITVDPYLPVPPTLYGGIERVVDFLVRRLVDRGHEVVLFAHPESRTPARLVPYGVPPHVSRAARARELVQLGGALLRHAARLDVVHSFGRLAALVPCLALRALPKIQSYQRGFVPWRSVAIAERLAGRSLIFTGCSTSVYADRPATGGGEWRTVFNGVDVEKYAFTPSVAADAPLTFLGRLERIKGAHNAIAIARAAGRRLVIAGNRVDATDDAGYFEKEIAPHLDGEAVRYVGPVNDAQKSELLGSSAAFLMPIEWEEPFGIVMAEALACGTPVIGFRRGSVPEVVRDGVNGVCCDTVEEAARAVDRVAAIDRAAVRRDCVARFGDAVIAQQYETLYRELGAGVRAAARRAGRPAVSSA